MNDVQARIEVPADVIRDLKRRALEERKTLKQLVREILTAAVARG